MYYPLIRSLLFLLNAEPAHTLSLKALQLLSQCHLYPKTTCDDPVELMGLTFLNRVGLAAGLDKNGQYIDALSHLGFGFIEVGTVTPLPQPGNPQPRLFRLPASQALINRLGFNNQGVEQLIENIRNARYFSEKKGILGINIGKNRSTPLEKSIDDYVYCMKQVYDYASYITVNISSPNTPNLRLLASEIFLSDLLKTLKAIQTQQHQRTKRYVPLVIKISPDMTQKQTSAMAKTCLAYSIDGIIATNTTVARPHSLSNLPHSNEQGGLSGEPLYVLSNQCIGWLTESLQGKIPVIGAGGILTPDSAIKKCQAGASLVQLYTGLIYKGPKLVEHVAQALKKTSDNLEEA